MTSLKDRVKNKVVVFEYYRDNALWYKCEDGFLFPVPIEDIGLATFLREEKALFLMRWINRYMKAIEEGKS